MTILSVVKDVCAAVGVAIPGSLFASLNANRTMQEMVALANEMAQRIAYDTRDWTALRTAHTFVGDGVAEAFGLPEAYKRLLLTTNVWRSTSTNQPMLFVPDTDEWIRKQLANEDNSPGRWIIMNDTMHIRPVMPVGTTASFAYLARNCISLASGGFGDRFMDDGDNYRLDERLLKLGMVWQWKALKGSPYAEDMGTYSDAIATAMGHDKPSPIIIGRKNISEYARVSGPWPASWGPQS